MRKPILPLLIPLLIACGGPRVSSQAEADRIFVGGVVYTMEPGAPAAQAIALGRDRILFVGANEEALKLRGEETKVIELDGKMVMPGFQDAHVHPLSGGVELAKCDLNGAASVDEIEKRVLEYARTHPNEPWITGGGWGLALFENANPSRQLLDSWIADRPVYLSGFDGHSAWVNTKALELSGITKKTPDPVDGRIERDKQGNPSGTLREGAMGLAKVPDWTPEEYLAGLRRGQELAHRFGITSWIDANVGKDSIAAYRELERRGELTARVVLAHSVDLTRGPEQIADIIKAQQELSGPRVRMTSAKIFADGVIEAKTAAVLEPYVGTREKGLLNAAPDRIAELVVALDRAGLDVHIHAIGDRGIRESLNALELARKQNGERDSRHTIAHLELIDPADIPRFASLGVIANFQPFWAYADAYINDFTLPVLAKERHRWLYPIQSVIATGAPVAAGSDWSVTSMNPLDGIQVAVTRQGLAGKEPVFLPEERVTLEKMLELYTLGAAYAARQEQTTGMLGPGKAADLIVLDRNLFDIPPGELHKAKVVMTMVAGTVVYQAKN